MSTQTENQKNLRLLVAKAANDLELAKELVDPEKVPAILEKYGIKLEGITLKFVQAKKDELVIAIPHPDDAVSVSGGGESWADGSNVRF